MDDITGRLQQLERMEIDLLDERKSVASQRLNEDYDLKERRAREDENWAERLRRKDQEEAELRLRRRELEIASVPSDSINSSSPSEVNTSLASSQSKSSSISSRLSTRSSITESNISAPMDSNSFTGPPEVKPLPQVYSTQSDGKPPILVTPPMTQRKRKGGLGKMEVRQKRVEGSRMDELRYRLPIAFDSTQEPLYVRPSDGKLVSLKCCIEGCKAAGFSSVDSLIRHVRKSCIMTHHGNRRLLSTITETIETCSHVVPGQDEEAIMQDVDTVTNHSITNPPSFFDERQQFASSAPYQGAFRSNGNNLDMKENLGSKDEAEESGIQPTDLASMIKTIPLTERGLQELCAREREKITTGRISEG